MKRRSVFFAGLWGAGAAWAQVPKFDDLMKEAQKVAKPVAPSGAVAGAGDDKTNAAGIKEALAVGTERAVASLSRENGYFGNAAVKILMPPSIQKVADVARQVGFQKQVDEFILSMNRAAEAAAPLASRFFGDAIREMSLDDVRGILTGGDTAATDYFSRKTRDKLYTAFKPVVAQKVGEVGATNAYKSMMSRYESVPLVRSQSVDLDDYVTNRSLDGLFRVVGEEEKKIRTDPVARTTSLLKTVFGK
jgi:hypothetical protein